jgi:2-desacetyl-2-hydroxyethyl bacteriochlorophyllide A dehydrogenase
MGCIPATMLAVVTTGHGCPEVLSIRRDVAVPTPAAGEVLVEVSAAAVNNTDLWSRQGAYGAPGDPAAIAGWRGVPLRFPLIQGCDVAGRVVAAGSSQDAGLVGRRVIVDPAAEYRDGLPHSIVGSEVDGGFAQFHVSAADRVHDVTESPLSDQELACLPISYGTALNMVERASCRAGERVLVTGASGGVGFAAVQILVARGCTVVAVTTVPKADIVEGAGADHIVRRDRDTAADIPEIDVIVDVVGGEQFSERLDRLATGGRVVTAGAIAGPLVNLDLRRLYLGQRTIFGSTMHTPAVFASLAELARSGAVRPRVAAGYPLTEIRAAQERFERKDYVGKIVLLPQVGAER